MANQVGHRTDGVLYRRVLVHAVLVVEVDRFDAQPLEGSFTRLPHVLGTAIDGALGGIVGIAHVAELGRDDHTIALSLDCPTNQLFVRERSVHIGGVQHVDAELERLMNRRDRFLLVARTVKLRHAHAAKADGKRVKALGAETSYFRGGAHLNS